MSQSGDATKEEKRLSLVLFLGAGASAGAGVYTTREFVVKFKESLEKERGMLPENFQCFFDALQPQQDDVEALLKLLYQHIDLTDEPLGKTVQRKEGVDPSAASRLRDLLLDFIHGVCYVSADKVDYLKPLSRLQWYSGGEPLEVFTANYDTAMEVFCFKNGIEFNNGFQRSWAPDSLDKDESVDVRLYKLHGSATWWITQEGRLVEVPVQWKERQVTTYYGSPAASLVVYPYDPGKKIPISTLDLLPKLRDRLQRAKLAVFIGYSFRDADIREILMDAARKNRGLYVVLVSPRAYETYRKWFAETASGVPSPLNGRVVCLPFLFEKVFVDLVDAYLWPLRRGRESYSLVASEETAMGRISPPSDSEYVRRALTDFAQAGHFEKVVGILGQLGSSKVDWHLLSDALPTAYVVAELCAAADSGTFLGARITSYLESHPNNVRLTPQETSTNGWKATGNISMVFPELTPLERDKIALRLREQSERVKRICAMTREDRITENVRKLISALDGVAVYLVERWPGHGFIPVKQVVEDGCRRNAEWNVIRDRLSTVGEAGDSDLLEQMRQCESKTFLNHVRKYWQ